MKKILIIEDDKGISELERDYLEIEGFEVEIATDGVTGVEKAIQNDYSCIILDIMLPKKDGFSICKDIRMKKELPILMVSAKREDIDKIRGLGIGADDYLTKPFAVKELLARIRSVTRRNGETFTPRLLTFANLEFNTETQEVKGENTIRLSSKEGKLLRYFLLNPEKELTTETVFSHVWNDAEEETTSIVWVYISYLRQKLDSVQAQVEITGEAGGTFRLTVKE